MEQATTTVLEAVSPIVELGHTIVEEVSSAIDTLVEQFTPEKAADRQREIDAVAAGRKELLVRTAPARRFAEQNRKRFADEIQDCAEIAYLNEDEGIIALLRGMGARPDRNEMLSKLNVPQMFIFGRHDDYIPQERAEAVAARHPQAEVVWLEQSGHMGFIEEPELCAEAIIKFIGRL